MDKRIEAFLNDMLSGEEIRQFEKDLKADSALSEELAFFLSVKKLASKDARAVELERRHREWTTAETKTTVIPFKKWPLSAVAAMLVISLGLTWYFWLNSSPNLQQLSTRYVADNFQTMSVQMGGSRETDSLQLAIHAFNDGFPGTTLEICKNILRRQPDHSEAMKIGGIAALRLKNYDDAIALFKSLGDDDSLYGNPGRFYEAIARLEQGGTQNEITARRLLEEVIQKNLEGKKEAERWLRD